MSVMGTSIAAGVAQAGHQAEQVARQRDRRTRERADSARRVADAYEALLVHLQESEDAESGARVRIDDQVPEHERATRGRSADRRREDGGAADETDTATLTQDAMAAPPAVESAARPTDPDRPLYHHLDIRV